MPTKANKEAKRAAMAAKRAERAAKAAAKEALAGEGREEKEFSPRDLKAISALAGVPVDDITDLIKDNVRCFSATQETKRGKKITVVFVSVNGVKGPNDTIFDEHEFARKIGICSFVVFIDEEIHHVFDGREKMTGHNNNGDDDDAEGKVFKNLVVSLIGVLFFVFTNKPCGEFSSGGTINVDDEYFIIVTSKNRPAIVPYDDLDNAEKYIDPKNKLLLSIFKMYRPYFKKNPELVKMLCGRRVFAEHVVGNHVPPLGPKHKEGLHFFGISGVEGDIVAEFEALKFLGFDVVEYYIVDPKDFVNELEEARTRQQIEGYVVHAVKVSTKFIEGKFVQKTTSRGFKVKTFWYFIWRLVREILKRITDRRDIVLKVWETIGVRSRSFLKFSPEELLAWRAKCMRFLHWCFQNDVSEADVNFMRGGSFPELLTRWVEDTGESLDIDYKNSSIPEEIDELLNSTDSRLSGVLVVVFTGRAGIGKTTLATALATKLGTRVLEHDQFKSEEFAGGHKADTALIKAIDEALARGEQTVIVTVSGAYNHLTNAALKKGAAIVAINPQDNMKDPQIIKFLEDVMMSRIGTDNHPLQWSLGIVQKVLKAQQKWSASVSANPQTSNVTFSGSVHYLKTVNGAVQRVSIEEQISEVLPQIEDFLKKAPTVNGKQLISAELHAPKIDGLLCKIPIPDGMVPRMHGATLVYDRSKNSYHYHQASKELGTEVLIMPKNLYVFDVDGGTAGGFDVDIYDKNGKECLDHLVASGVPHVTVWGPDKWKPAEMKDLLKKAGEEQIVHVEGLSELRLSATVM